MICSAISRNPCWRTPSIDTRMPAGGLFGGKMARALLYGIYGPSRYHMPEQAWHCLGPWRLFSNTPARVFDVGFNVHPATCVYRTNSQLGPPGKYLDPLEC